MKFRTFIIILRFVCFYVAVVGMMSTSLYLNSAEAYLKGDRKRGDQYRHKADWWQKLIFNIGK